MNLTGIIAYPITPFAATGKGIDLDVLEQTLNRLIDSDCDAIAPLGSTGESAYLDWDEWYAVAKHTVDMVNKRVPVVIGISELTTDMAIKKAQTAAALGADAIMVIPVSYWKLSDSEIFDYYQSIAESMPLPIMVYNNPATSGVDISPELMVKMFNQIANVSMVKESSGDIQRMHKIFELSAGQLPFYNGSNPLALEALCAGASGWCTAAPNLLGALPKRLYNSIKQGDLATAQNLFYRQLPLLRFIVAGGLPKTIKAGLETLGVNAGVPRKPLQAASAAELNALNQYIQDIQMS